MVMDKLLFRSLLVLMPGLWLLTATSAQANVFEWKSDDESKSINVGGAVRVNQRYESWGEENSSGVGNLKFDIFRLDVDGKYDDFYLDSSYVFQDNDKTAIEKAYVGYNFDEKNSVEAGLVYK